jgi:hypothetical protein
MVNKHNTAHITSGKMYRPEMLFKHDFLTRARLIIAFMAALFGGVVR